MTLLLHLELNPTWVYPQVYCDVEPKRQALAQTNLELAAATEKLEAIRKKLLVSTNSNTEGILWGGEVGGRSCLFFWGGPFGQEMERKLIFHVCLYW